MRNNKSLHLPRKTRTKWGQNFLRDKKILNKIVDFAQIAKGDVVVEIGPGEGTLTKFLLERANKVIAIEKDERMAKELKERLKEGKKERLEVICADILELPDGFFSIFFGEKSAKPRTDNWYGAKREKKPSGSGGYKLVGNIPFYITGAIFKKFLQSDNPPQSITFVVQKEVAERIMARNGKESILSISIKAYGKPEFGGVIKAGGFYPRPKIDSALISVRNINKKRFAAASPPNPLPLEEGAGGGAALSDSQKLEQRFFEILKAGFAHKRKLLINNLGVDKEIFRKCGIPEKARAENLSVEDWVCLTKVMRGLFPTKFKF